MKKLFIILFLSLSALTSSANHITGGEMYYTLTSVSGNSYTYHVVLKLYRDCNAPIGSADLDDFAAISIFDKANNSSVWSSLVNKLYQDTLSLGSPDPCINNPPPVCYQVGYYEFDVTLQGNLEGYTITYQRCCRIAGINNLLGSNNVGATFTADIPGTSVLASGPANNSARFTGADTVIVCADNYFCYDFGATDSDTDSLAYYFCSAVNGGNTGNPAPNPPANPPYSGVPYASPFSSSSPLGPGVTLDPRTGMMCGTAPVAGIYVVTVCVSEYRNGVLIATQRKDLQIKVGDCDMVLATLPSSIPMCDDFTKTFQNQSPSNSLMHSWIWDFGDGSPVSTLETPTHTYADTGTYNITLIINQGEPCTVTASTVAHVYPGFFTGFEHSGICATKPTLFTDTSHAVYGFVDSWSWNFGDNTTNADTSHLQNPSYTYPANGTMPVQLIVTTNKGCIDTVVKNILIQDKPPMTLLPTDTLICNGDAVQLEAVGNGTFSWTGPNMINGNTATPTVSPTTTSQYIVQLNDNGCINQDTVTVNVVDFVTLQAMPDTIICATDSVRLHAFTDGLQYSWSPPETIDDPTKLNPGALPVGNITYQITAIIGSCQAVDEVNITLAPYPVADAGPDSTICFDGTAQLHGSMVGSNFTWSPSASLNDAFVLEPFASPFSTTQYILTVTDNIGCPKPKRDTVVVTVLPMIIPFAGNDTAVVVGQPLQFHATGGTSYSWSPPIALSDVNIHNPVAVYDGTTDSITYKVVVRNESGCPDSAFITVRIFNTDPQVFVPSAFTPNGDGMNDVFRPIAVGLTHLEYFRVYNRWGQLVFSTTTNENGWDGRIGGKDQGSGTFVWLVRGVDFTGKIVFAKGTVTLIR